MSERLTKLREAFARLWSKRPRLPFRRKDSESEKAETSRPARRAGERKPGFRIRRGWLTVAVIVLLLVVGVLFLTIRGRQARETAQLGESLRSAEIGRGTLSVTVNATGELESVHEAELPFLTAGEVLEVHVEPGQAVRKGALLAALDTSLLEFDLRDAEIAHQLQEIALEELKAGPSEEELAVVRASLNLAQAQLNQVTAPPDAYDLEIAEMQIEMARNQLYREQTSRDMAVELSGPGPGADWQEEIGLENAAGAELGIQSAEVQKLQMLQGPSAGQVATARAQVVAAQAQLNSLLEGADEYDLAIASKQVEVAGLSVALARTTMENASIRAPFDGTVAEVNVDVGESVLPQQVVIRLVDESEYRLVLDVDEVDIASVHEEQPVEITLDALPDVVLTGHVTAVSPISNEVGGVVSYPVEVKLDATDEPLRAGMTATAVITVDELDSALLVPNWAVRIDRQTGEAFVNVRSADGIVEEVKVRIGLRNDMFSQVLSGLDTGDEVVVSQDREELSLFGGEEQ